MEKTEPAHLDCMQSHISIITGLVLLLCLAGCMRGAEPANEPVQAAQIASGQAVSVVLSDGRTDELRLAGVRLPYRLLYPDETTQARRALDASVSEPQANIVITREFDRDRYKRLIASVDVNGADLAERLVEAGHMMVWPAPGENVDYDRLYRAETRARDAGAGAWADAAFSVHDPDANRLSQYLDSPVVVQGRVVGVGRARNGRVFLNFGLDWRTDFTVMVSRQDAVDLETDGFDLDALDGAVIRVRGWLIEENGPGLYLRHRAQIELVDAPEPVRLPIND